MSLLFNGFHRFEVGDEGHSVCQLVNSGQARTCERNRAHSVHRPVWQLDFNDSGDFALWASGSSLDGRHDLANYSPELVAALGFSAGGNKIVSSRPSRSICTSTGLIGDANCSPMSAVSGIELTGLPPIARIRSPI